MLSKQIVLIDQSATVDAKELAAVADAFTAQIGHLGKFWPVAGTVRVLPADAAVPPGCWPVYIVAGLPPDEGGFHLNKNLQPYAKIAAGDGWALAASHELCEMLVDPSGNLTHASVALQVQDGKVLPADGVFEYLVEVSDPSESDEHGYTINGIAVSDFYTPHYFDKSYSQGVQYSYTRALTEPRQVLKYGYLSWHHPGEQAWQQLNFVDCDPPQIMPMKQVVDLSSLRQRSDASIMSRRQSA